MTKLNQQIHLPDGRRLGYDEYGPSDGAPVFYFHGSPSSRVEFRLFGNEALLQGLRVRLFAVDRPGIGLSDFQANRRLIDWPRDVLALADHLGLGRFAILAYSLGGPSGAACAHAIPGRLTKVGLLSSPAPFDQPGLADEMNPPGRRFLQMTRENTRLARLSLWMMGIMTRLAPEKFITAALDALPMPDRETASDPDFQERFLAMVQESVRQGPRGAQHDARLGVSEWEFQPQDIRMPVLLWHGEADRNAPIAMGRYMAETIPNSKAKFYPNEGHLSLFKKNAEEIIGSMVN